MVNNNLIEINDNEVLIVDDQPKNLKVLSQLLLSDGYEVRIANSGKMALNSLKMQKVNLIILDINMPEMDGFEVARHIMADKTLKNIPIIFVSAASDIESKITAFKNGAVDFISKPYILEEVQARVKAHYQLSMYQKLLTNENKQLQNEVIEKSQEISSAQKLTIEAMIHMAETRDDDTGKHIIRISKFCEFLAQQYMKNNSLEVDENFISNILVASPLHDIGKVGIQDNILLKPGKLTADEFEIMKTHVSIGASQLEKISHDSPNNDYLKMAVNIAKFHHEKWDGSGYMSGLSGDNIPLEARIMAIADVYDALRSKRVYKDAFSHTKAMTIMEESRGSHFDPKLLDLFIEQNHWFEKKYNDLSEVE